jgi:hypothetical protein
MINNFEKLKKHIIFTSEDDFYFLQILKRKKEHPELGSNSVTVATYYVDSIEKYEKIEDEIINLCTFHNARAYINLNKRSYENLAFQTLRKITDIIMNKDYKHVSYAYNSVCGVHHNAGENKKWVIDIDSVKQVSPLMMAFIDHECRPFGSKCLDIVQTKNGFHLITKPFDIQEFSKEYPDIQIHKNNPTVLIIPK